MPECIRSACGKDLFSFKMNTGGAGYPRTMAYKYANIKPYSLPSKMYAIRKENVFKSGRRVDHLPTHQFLVIFIFLFLQTEALFW